MISCFPFFISRANFGSLTSHSAKILLAAAADNRKFLSLSFVFVLFTSFSLFLAFVDLLSHLLIYILPRWEGNYGINGSVNGKKRMFLERRQDLKEKVI